MAETNKSADLPDTVDAELDRLLGEWAGDVLIGLERQENAILSGVLVLTDDLGYGWWRQLCDQFSFHRNAEFPSWPVNKEAV
jgi:hypothetical protein